MASSNVEYYARQKEIQEKMHEYEQKRLQLDQQMKSYCKSDERLAKLRATKLQSYWKRVCEDQKRSQQRNEQILRDLDRMDSHLASMSARTQKLKLLKQQYTDYIERTYPQWREQVIQWQQQKQVAQQQQQQPQQVQSVPSQQQPAQQGGMMDSSIEFTYQQQQQQQQQQKIQPVVSTPVQQKVTSQGRQHYPPSPYVNVSDVMRDPSGHVYDEQESITPFNNYQSEAEQSTHFNRYQTEPTPQLNRYQRDTPTKGRPADKSPQLNHYQVDRDVDTELKFTDQVVDVSVSDDIPDEMISHPMSVKVERIVQRLQAPEDAQQRDDAESPDLQSRSFSGPMDQDINDEDDNSSNFNEEDDQLSGLSGRQAPTPSHQEQRTAAMEDVSDAASIPSSREESPIPPVPIHIFTAEDDHDVEGTSLKPDLSTEGIIRLLQYVQDDLPHALSLNGYYRSHMPSPADRLDIIYKANGGVNLNGLDAELVSMVILEQMTLVVRRMDSGCLLTDSLLSGDINSVSEIIMMSLDAQPLWDKLFQHFILLVKSKAMEAREIAAVFTPSIVSDSSQFQDKAFNLLVRLLEKYSDDTEEQNGGSPREAAESITRSSVVKIGPDGNVQEIRGKVPPLKFGSLVETKYSDEESTAMLTPSISTDIPKVP
ncbi:hypothetical protein KUTeg_014222 [Tegillarca granosa]|uniref:Centrosomal protein kizuna n=1 Tax=Tegillarca granosa TaxID=220873 RepID=A0ABQ9EW15_TEGGR|nr:hypothetical protein KUTeg_014222 [Tegillarca granosa]